MASDANAYKVASGTADGAIPLLYGSKVIEQLYNAQKLVGLGDDISMMFSGAGTTAQIPIDNTHWSVSALTEGVATAISALDYDKKTITFAWYGDAKQWTIEAEAVVLPYVLENMRGKAASALGENRDNVIITELGNTSTAAIYPFVITAGVVTDVKYTDADIVASAFFQYEQVVSAETQMIEAKLVLKNVVVPPRFRMALLKDERFISNDQYNKDVMEKAIVSTVSGVKVILHNALPTADEGVDDLVEVGIGYALMEKPFFYAQKRQPVFELDRINILERNWTFHYYEALGVKNVRDAGIIPLKAAMGNI
jgi:hypothetical protein